jgi:glycosyltransferase involved in cell wall biosynthesis
MKVAIHTSALGPIHSGGIRCIVYFLNILKERGFDVQAFVDTPPFNSTWLDSHFSVLPSNSDEYLQYGGILISPYTPTMRRVAAHSKASHRIIWMHTAEFAFDHSGKEFTKEAIECCKLRNVHYMTTSNYVATFLNLIFKQKVLPYRVPGGVDSNIFKFDQDIYDEKMKLKKITFCMLNRPEPLRGIDIGLQAFDLLQKEFGDIVEMKLFAGLPQNEMYKAYGSAHFFVDPSLVAGYALPPLECCSCGTVPISTIFGAMDYIKDGENGFLINAGDVQHTYEVMKECVNIFIDQTKQGHAIYYQQLVDEARTMAARHTWEQMANNFIANLRYLNA